MENYHLARIQNTHLGGDEICINLIGPWQVALDGQKLEFSVLNMMDLAPGLSDLIRIPNN